MFRIIQFLFLEIFLLLRWTQKMTNKKKSSIKKYHTVNMHERYVHTFLIKDGNLSQQLQLTKKKKSRSTHGSFNEKRNLKAYLYKYSKFTSTIFMVSRTECQTSFTYKIYHTFCYGSLFFLGGEILSSSNKHERRKGRFKQKKLAERFSPSIKALEFQMNSRLKKKWVKFAEAKNEESISLRVSHTIFNQLLDQKFEEEHWKLPCEANFKTSHQAQRKVQITLSKGLI